MKFCQLYLICLLSIVFTHDIIGQCFPTQNYTIPGIYTYTVPGSPSTTYEVQITSRGGDGGNFQWGGNPSSAGGKGAYLQATYDLQGGDQLFIIVGEAGSNALGSPGGGGGGGGSAVIINSSEVLIAAAAGGGGGQNSLGGGAFASTNSPAQGGNGPGASGGGGFNQAGMTGQAGTGGGAGTLTSQGIGGTQGVVAGPGGNGFGAGGGGAGTGGGGGGGYKGGDGAANGSLNGKGGDSFVSTLYNAALVTATAGATGGGLNLDGAIAITCNSVSGGTSATISVSSQMNPSCFGSTDGSITVAGADGSGGYMYSINNGAATSNPVFTGLAAGTYTIVVTDSAGSSDSVIVTLSEPSEITFNVLQIVNNNCFGGMEGIIEVEAQGGSGSYLYALNGVSFQVNGLFTNLSSENHTIVATDNTSGCIVSQSFSLTEPAAITSNTFISQGLDCFGDNDAEIGIKLEGGTGNLTAIYDGISTTIMSGDTVYFDNLAADTINIDIMDGNACMSSNEIIITQPDSLIIDITDTIPVNCELGTNGSAILAASGGTSPFVYEMNNSTVTTGSFSDLAAGTYTAEVSDNNGCLATLDVDILQTGNLLVTDTIINDVNCFGEMNGSIELMVSGGSGSYNHTANGTTNSTGVFNNLQADDYSISINDGQGCEAALMLSVLEPAELNITIDSTGSGFVRVTASGGIGNYTYSIDGGNTFQVSNEFPNLDEGDYTIIVQDDNGCTNSIDLSVTVSSNANLDPAIQSISLHPVPVQSLIFLEMDFVEKRNISIQIYTMAGKMVLHQNKGTLAQGQHSLSFDVSHLPEGHYVFKMLSDAGIYAEKILKVK